MQHAKDTGRYQGKVRERMNETIVSMRGICKSFPGVKALDNVHFELRSGEVMALLGENGAGKSTLMKILSGVYTRDSGSVEIFGKEYGDLTPKQAQALGVAIIHQELNMCPHLSVTENMFLGRERYKGPVLDRRGMEAEAKRILDDLCIDISPSETVGNLPVSKQQMVEIAKALSINARVLIMDEPTSALTAKEIDELFRIIRRLKDSGCGIVYISHRLEELQHIVDRVTIMRDGQYITSTNFVDTTMADIITNMVGREIKEQFPRVECQKGEKIFEVKHLNAGRIVRDISFSLYAGEIVGFAGLMGAGRTETTRAIFGADPRESGEIFLDGKKITIHTPSDAIKAGIVLYMNHQFRFRGHQRPNRADMVKMPVREQNRGNRAPVRRFADALRLVAGVNHHAVSARIVPEDVAARSNRADGDFLHLQHGSILLRQNALVESIKIVTGPSLTSDT